MINTLLNNDHVAKIICTDENKLGAGNGFMVWLVANKGYDFGTYRDNDYEEDFPLKDMMFKGKTINEALHQASDFLLNLRLNKVTRNIKDSGVITGESISQCKEFCNNK